MHFRIYKSKAASWFRRSIFRLMGRLGCLPTTVTLSVQKVSDVNSDLCSFEVVSSGVPLLAVAASVDGIAEVYLSNLNGDFMVTYDSLIEALQRCRSLLQQEIEESRLT